jgi:hypothetical protein
MTMKEYARQAYRRSVEFQRALDAQWFAMQPQTPGDVAVVDHPAIWSGPIGEYTGGGHIWDINDVCTGCGVARRRFAERGGSCVEPQAKPAGRVAHPPLPARALNPPRRCDAMLGPFNFIVPPEVDRG